MKPKSRRIQFQVLALVSLLFLLFEGQSFLRRKSFEAGIDCVTEGPIQRLTNGSDQCYQFFMSKINSLQEQIDNQSRSVANQTSILKLRKQKEQWILLMDTGVFR